MTNTCPCKDILLRTWAVILWPIIFLLALGAFAALRGYKAVMYIRKNLARP